MQLRSYELTLLFHEEDLNGTEAKWVCSGHSLKELAGKKLHILMTEAWCIIKGTSPDSSSEVEFMSRHEDCSPWENSCMALDKLCHVWEKSHVTTGLWTWRCEVWKALAWVRQGVCNCWLCKVKTKSRQSDFFVAKCCLYKGCFNMCDFRGYYVMIPGFYCDNCGILMR